MTSTPLSTWCYVHEVDHHMPCPFVVWNGRSVTMDNHPAFGEFDHRDDSCLPCACYDAGYDGHDPWVGMPHRDEYADGQQAAYERTNDI